MKFVADVHLHSHYSRATSKNLDFEHLSKWAQLKGVHVVGTGDIAHPGWLQEMKDKLEPAEEGLFQIKPAYAKEVSSEVFPACQAPVRFMLAGEISSIYKKNDKVRKIHNVIFAPTLEAVEKIQAALEKIGNIRSDGRPILGLDSRDLLEIILDIDPQNYLIPAHIWTPWFALLGSKSGFDSVEECFEDLTPHIFALETGLSSDPPMNWRVSALDGYTLVSNSDAHSPPKLAREANLFDTELSYPAFFEALKTGDPNHFLGTLEFFPEEGKYHYDGHRKCGIRWEPQTTLAHDAICSVCGKKVTVGVMHRVETLADRPDGDLPARRHPFRSLIPLPEILSEVYGVGPNSKRVRQNYESLLARLGSELSILLDIPLEEIEQAGGTLLAEGIRRVRRGEVTIAAGYDGEYGVIKLFGEQEKDVIAGQLSLFGTREKKAAKVKTPPAQPAPKEPAAADEPASQAWIQPDLFAPAAVSEAPGSYTADSAAMLASLNPQQREAARCIDAPLIIVAGPGTGKTRTLTYRIAYLLVRQGVSPENILAITFTNKAAAEMEDRLAALLGSVTAGQITVRTFHAFGALILRTDGEQLGLKETFTICNEEDRRTLLKQSCPDLTESTLTQYLDGISAAKNELLTPDSPDLADHFEPDFIDCYRQYQLTMRIQQTLDFDDLILQTVRLLETSPETLAKYQSRYRWISVDEYQDINFAQYRLLKLLTAAGSNLCAIGDPDQAIYGFRGADRAYFLQFQEDFPGARVLHLSQNYRSTQLILDASEQVIAHSSDRERIEIWSEFIDQTKLDVYRALTDKAEAEYIVHQIEKQVGGTSYFSLDSGRVDDDDTGGRAFADFAVLYRLGAQSELLIEAFQRSGIPYQTVGQKSLYDYKEIKLLLAYLWHLYNPEAVLPLEQILQTGRSKTRAAALAKLVAYAETAQMPVGQAVQNYTQVKTLTATQQQPLSEIGPFLAELRAASESRSVAQLIEMVYQFTLDRLDLTPDEAAAERIRQLSLQAVPFEDRLAAFLEATALQKETDAYDPRADRVTLMTLHASKGLEFPVVFIVGCEEGIIPYQRPGKTFDLEEERRLFYVGMTRAQHKLILTHAKKRFLFGQAENNEPSQFLDDIEQALKEIKQMAARKEKRAKPEANQLKLF